MVWIGDQWIRIGPWWQAFVNAMLEVKFPLEEGNFVPNWATFASIKLDYLWWVSVTPVLNFMFNCGSLKGWQMIVFWDTAWEFQLLMWIKLDLLCFTQESTYINLICITNFTCAKYVHQTLTNLQHVSAHQRCHDQGILLSSLHSILRVARCMISG